MSTKPDGGPAFPHVTRAVPGHPDAIELLTDGGMTIRDYFAAAALTGIVANLDAYTTSGAHEVAHLAFSVADAMLSERTKEAE